MSLKDTSANGCEQVFQQKAQHFKFSDNLENVLGVSHHQKSNNQFFFIFEGKTGL